MKKALALLAIIILSSCTSRTIQVKNDMQPDKNNPYITGDLYDVNIIYYYGEEIVGNDYIGVIKCGEKSNKLKPPTKAEKFKIKWNALNNDPVIKEKIKDIYEILHTTFRSESKSYYYIEKGENVVSIGIGTLIENGI